MKILAVVMQSGLLNFKFGQRRENIGCSHVVRFYTFGGWTLSNTGCSHIGRSSALYLTATYKKGLIRTNSLKNLLQSRSQVSKTSNLDRLQSCSHVFNFDRVDTLDNWLQSCSQTSQISNLDGCMKILAEVMQSGLLNFKF